MIRRKKLTIFTDAKDTTSVLELKKIIEGKLLSLHYSNTVPRYFLHFNNNSKMCCIHDNLGSSLIAESILKPQILMKLCICSFHGHE